MELKVRVKLQIAKLKGSIDDYSTKIKGGEKLLKTWRFQKRELEGILAELKEIQQASEVSNIGREEGEGRQRP